MSRDEPTTAGVHAFRVVRDDGTVLAGDSHLPAGEASRQVLLVHGFAEHRGRYAETIAALTAAGCAVHAFDLRGHGDSDGRRGHVEAFADYRRDLAAVVADRAASPRCAGLPLVLFGHSLGGLIALDQVLFDAAPFVALALSSPFLAPAFRVPAWKEAVAALAAHLPPWIAFPADLDPAGLSHDPAVVAAYRDDPKVFDDLSASWYVAVDTAQEEVGRRAGEVRLPLLMLLGGADPVADPEASRRFFAAVASRDKRLEVYDGMLHEVLNETERARVRTDLLEWLSAVVPRPAG